MELIKRLFIKLKQLIKILPLIQLNLGKTSNMPDKPIDLEEVKKLFND